jgi:hypothetical protein
MDACAAAVELASEAVRILRATEFLTLRADVFLDLAAALHASGDITEAARAAEQGRVLYERKGHRVAARRVRETARLATRQA